MVTTCRSSPTSTRAGRSAKVAGQDALPAAQADLHPQPADAGGVQPRLSPEVRDFWLNFQTWFMSRELQNLMLARFEPQLRGALRRGDAAAGRRCRDQRDDQLPRGRLLHRARIQTRRTASSPRSSTSRRMVRPRRWARTSTVRSTRATGGPTTASSPTSPGCPTAPYRRNSAILFLRTPKSYHGVERITEEHGARSSKRYVLQYMLIHKKPAPPVAADGRTVRNGGARPLSGHDGSLRCGCSARRGVARRALRRLGGPRV